MYASHERLGQAIQAFATHAPDHEALERLVVQLAGCDLLWRDQEVHGHPDFPGPREEAGRSKRHELRGREHHDTIRHLMKFASRQDPRPSPGVVGRQLVIEDPR